MEVLRKLSGVGINYREKYGEKEFFVALPPFSAVRYGWIPVVVLVDHLPLGNLLLVVPFADSAKDWRL